ncbi:PEP-CTERM sorting domain-containing protein [Paucibacter sp. Y2R2-4]|uniref:PEP-CTERM sorting domain-containing protein n=1 Tax=Paucibacter sp. Y2R2-4 TaxID=2893553 RepID=UPI0021E3F78D|nr:PEP-CTERM sorting domain-containing protein [Paucibacter sp. Y2R2-4]MCV2349418.1 PEP-CTERM sorting domain-containing protein [Paucibacter sp. Y2R2-4]
MQTLRRLRQVLSAVFFAGCLMSGSLTQASAIVTFDDLIQGQVSYGFDGDADGINDVVFSTSDPAGFNTIGPGVEQSFVHEPGLEGTSLLNPDLRVDFLRGATGNIKFGFALLSTSESPDWFASFKVFDANHVLLGSVSAAGAFSVIGSGQSSFPEGQISLSFAGVAAYGLFDFASQGGRFIMDDFAGDFGSVVPEPSTWALLLLGCGMLLLLRRRPQF